MKSLFAIGWVEVVLAVLAPGVPAASIPRYEVFEAVLTAAKTYANPFQDVTVTATFTAPSGRKLTAYGFHDGVSTWRVRIAPDEVGPWRYTTTSDTGDPGLHQQSGSFQCVSSLHKGFIRADPMHPYYLSFSDGTPLFALGDTFTVTSPTLSETNRRAYLDARAGKPFNFLRVFASYTFNAWTDRPHPAVTANPAEFWPWGGTPEIPDYDRLNPQYFQRFERILRDLKTRGVFAEIIVFNLYEQPFKDRRVWTAARERLWAQYLLSRWAADTTVFLWTITQEYERYPSGQYKHEPADDEWVRAMGTLLREFDQRRHPITVHPWGGHGPAGGEAVVESGAIGQRFGSGPELDVLTHQHNSYATATTVAKPLPGYQDGPAVGVEKAIWADRKFNKPVINTEYGYEWLEAYPANFNSQAHGADKCRRAAWRIFTSGGAGLAAGFSGTYLAGDHAEIYYDRQQRFAPFKLADMGHVRQLQHLDEFVTRRTDFREMNPAQALVNTPNLCLANPAQEYVVYAPGGGDVALDLLHARGDFSVEWLNPRNGAYQSAGSVAAAARRTWIAPDTNDWVLHLKQSSRPARHDWQERLERAARSPESWRARRQEIRQRILVSAGLWPEFERPPLQPVIFHRIERDGYTVENVHFETWPGLHLSGNLYRPRGKAAPFPAVLFAQGHGVNGRFGDGPRSEIAAGAITLARMGFVVFCYDMVGYCDFKQLAHGFGEPRWEPQRFRFAAEPKNAMAQPAADRLWGLNLLGLQLWNSLRVMDFLAGLPDVDPRRIAATGASGGGTQTFLLTAVDDRVACAAPVCMVAAEFQGGCLCENAPLLRIDLNNVEITACAAPRPLLLVSATGDWTKHNLRLEAPAIREVYQSLGVEERFRCVQFEAPHNYNRSSREVVYAWFARWLQNSPDAERIAEPPFSVEKREDLTIWTADHPRPEGAVDAAGLAALLKERIKAQLQALSPRDPASLRHFQVVMRPALQHTFTAHWPDPNELEIRADGFVDQRGAKFEKVHLRHRAIPGTVEVLQQSGPRGAADPPLRKLRTTLVVTTATDDLAGLLEGLGAAGDRVLLLQLKAHEREPVSGGTAEQHELFPSTYYRTPLAWHVQDVLTTVAYAARRPEVEQVRLVGLGEAGIAALLAQALVPSDALVLAIGDVSGLDDRDEKAWMGQRVHPGLLRIGALRAAAMLSAASAGQLVLHNTQGRFQTIGLEAAYRAVGREFAWRVSEAGWETEKILQALK